MILICGKYSKRTSRRKEDDMGNKYEDFDLDLKSSEENSGAEIGRASCRERV